MFNGHGGAWSFAWQEIVKLWAVERLYWACSGSSMTGVSLAHFLGSWWCQIQPRWWWPRSWKNKQQVSPKQITDRPIVFRKMGVTLDGFQKDEETWQAQRKAGFMKEEKLKNIKATVLPVIIREECLFVNRRAACADFKPGGVLKGHWSSKWLGRLRHMGFIYRSEPAPFYGRQRVERREGRQASFTI